MNNREINNKKRSIFYYSAIIFLFSFIICSLSLSQFKNSSLVSQNYVQVEKIDTISVNSVPDNIRKENSIIKGGMNIGFQVGLHTSNLVNTSSAVFNKDIFIELYTKFRLAKNIHSIIAFNYWQSKINGINNAVENRPVQNMNSKSLKLGLDFSLLQTKLIMFALGSSASIEDINISSSAVLSLATHGKLSVAVLDNKMKILSTVSYQNGSEYFNFGGGINYSFLNYLIGVEFSINE